MAHLRNLAGARSMPDDLLLSKRLSGEDVIVQIHRPMHDIDLPDKKVTLI